MEIIYTREQVDAHVAQKTKFCRPTPTGVEVLTAEKIRPFLGGAFYYLCDELGEIILAPECCADEATAVEQAIGMNREASAKAEEELERVQANLRNLNGARGILLARRQVLGSELLR